MGCSAIPTVLFVMRRFLVLSALRNLYNTNWFESINCCHFFWSMISGVTNVALYSRSVPLSKLTSFQLNPGGPVHRFIYYFDFLSLFLHLSSVVYSFSSKIASNIRYQPWFWFPFPSSYWYAVHNLFRN